MHRILVALMVATLFACVPSAPARSEQPERSEEAREATAAMRNEQFARIVAARDVQRIAANIDGYRSHPRYKDAQAILTEYEARLRGENVPQRMREAIRLRDADLVRQLVEEFPIRGASAEAYEYLAQPEVRANW